MSKEGKAISGVLVVRAWVEGAPSDGLRARITHTRGLDGQLELELTAAGVNQVLAVVRAWLAALLNENQADS
jgi:hypothetical protein